MMILGLSVGDFIAALGLALALLSTLIGGFYTIITNTKRFELSEEYRKELISWYTSVSLTIEKILSGPETKSEALGELSALIDVGRMYFPNVIRGDGFGSSKPLAHQGYRHVALSLLVRIFNDAMREDISACREEIVRLKKQFNSIIFYIISPRERIKKLRVHADIIVPPPAAYNAGSDLETLNITEEWVKHYVTPHRK